MLKHTLIQILILFYSIVVNFKALSPIPIAVQAENEKHKLEYIDSISSNMNSLLHDNTITIESKKTAINQLLNSSIRNFGYTSTTTSFIIHKKGVMYHNLGYQGIPGSYDSAIANYNTALKIRLQLYQSDTINLVSDIFNGYNMIGICYSRKGDQFNSINYLLKGLNYTDLLDIKKTEYNRILKLYTQIARTFTSIGDYDQALKYYQSIVNFSTEDIVSEGLYIINDWKINALLEISALYSNQLYDPEAAHQKLIEAENIINNFPNVDYNYYLNDLFTKRGIIQLRKHQFENAKTCFESALKLNQKAKGNFELAANQMNLSVVLLNLDILDTAEYLLHHAIKIYKGSSAEYMLASIYDNYGDLEFKRRNYQKSLDYDNLSLTYMIAGFKPKSIFENPSLESKNISDKIGVLISLSSKAETFIKLYEIEDTIKYLDAAYSTFQLADQVISMMRSEFQAEASRMSLASYAKPIYEQGIEACHLLYKLHTHDSLLDKAFEYSEKSRAIVLLDAVRKTNASAHVNQELFRQEKAMNLKANYFERQAALMEPDSTMNISYNVYDSLLFYRRKRLEIVDQISQSTPEYYKLIFDQATTKPKEIRQNLNEDQAFIEYFLGDSSLYTFYIDIDTTLLLKYEQPDSIISWANDWLSSIPKMNTEFIAPANNLYRALFQSVRQKVDLPEKLIIVPDGILNLVNYEALVTEIPNVDRIYLPDFKDYLIFDHTISYAFSASTLKESVSVLDQPNRKYLGVAPSLKEGFYQDEVWFDPLDYNQEEVEEVASFFPRKNIIETISAKEQFLELAPSYGLIHCATHALANNEDGDLSFIMLGQKDSDVIYAKDLYALDLNANMVVLSACQTSAGEVNRGEGIISLARSFTYAGAASVVTSLWNVRDKTNKEIIYGFYQLLKKGIARDEALRAAKLNYLASISRENEAGAHPYFWAPMVITGDVSPMQFNLYWRQIVFAFALVIMIFLIYRRFKKTSTS
jgi:CHAT domain-containing protein